MVNAIEFAEIKVINMPFEICRKMPSSAFGAGNAAANHISCIKYKCNFIGN
jgi:hypothetical protein